MELQKIIDQLQVNLMIIQPVAKESARLVKSYTETIEKLKHKQQIQEKGDQQ